MSAHAIEESFSRRHRNDSSGPITIASSTAETGMLREAYRPAYTAKSTVKPCAQPQVAAANRQRRQRDQQQHQKTLLRDPMKVGRLKFVDVVHQEAVRKIGVDVSVQLPSIRIRQAGHGRKQRDPRQTTRDALRGRDLSQRILESVFLRREPDPAPRPARRFPTARTPPPSHRAGSPKPASAEAGARAFACRANSSCSKQSRSEESRIQNQASVNSQLTTCGRARKWIVDADIASNTSPSATQS